MKVGDRVKLTVCSGLMCGEGVAVGDIFVITHIYADGYEHSSFTLCDTRRERDGLKLVEYSLARYIKIGIMNNKERVKLRKEQLANAT